MMQKPCERPECRTMGINRLISIVCYTGEKVLLLLTGWARESLSRSRLPQV